jgi:hypothetical protein
VRGVRVGQLPSLHASPDPDADLDVDALNDAVTEAPLLLSGSCLTRASGARY